MSDTTLTAHDERQAAIMHHARGAADDAFFQMNDDTIPVLAADPDAAELPTWADFEAAADALGALDGDEAREYRNCYWVRMIEHVDDWSRRAGSRPGPVRDFLDTYATDFEAATNALHGGPDAAAWQDVTSWWTYRNKHRAGAAADPSYMSDFVRGLLTERPATPPATLNALCSLLSCAVEGGSTYWAAALDISQAAGLVVTDKETGEEYAADFEDAWQVVDNIHDTVNGRYGKPGGGIAHRCLADLQAALCDPCASDADTGDNWLQLVMFGGVQFG